MYIIHETFLFEQLCNRFVLLLKSLSYSMILPCAIFAYKLEQYIIRFFDDKAVICNTVILTTGDCSIPLKSQDLSDMQNDNQIVFLSSFE